MNQPMSALPFILVAVCLMSLAYRYYSAFLAAKVLSLDDSRKTPAVRREDGQNYVPTNRWVLFGHHFAAITGAGPLIGPVLAAQFGFLPGYLWLVIGVVISGAVHDFTILVGSVRHEGRSLAEITRAELGPWAGRIVGMAILFIIVIALAGLGVAVVNALEQSSWATFTLATTIPVAFVMGFYMHGKEGRILPATAFGVVCLIAAVVLGRWVPGTSWGHLFALPRGGVIIAIAAYGFIASVLPVWMLLCPRDYLSSFMKLGTIGALTIAMLLVNPELKMPMLTPFASGGGPIVPGKLFPFVFITIACGAISGFHALIASGTTPKMIKRESDCRMIGYGAMLCEGWVGLTSLIAAAALFPEDYFAINTTAEKFATLGMNVVNLPELSNAVGEQVAGRPGGAVSLAVGMAQIFSSIPGLGKLMAYWYHFAILFEALFILTTIDTGTRVARFLVQEIMGKASPAWGKQDWLPSTLVATGLVVAAWASFIWTGSIATIWPLFGVANQLLAAIALVVGTTLIISWGKRRYAWTTLVPLAMITVITVTAGIQSVTQNYLPLARKGQAMGYLNSVLVVVMLFSLLAILMIGLARWRTPGVGIQVDSAGVRRQKSSGK
jgi:carbon starvation protein